MSEIEIRGMRVIMGLHDNAGTPLLRKTYNMQLYKPDAWNMLWISTQNKLLWGMKEGESLSFPLETELKASWGKEEVEKKQNLKHHQLLCPLYNKSENLLYIL